MTNTGGLVADGSYNIEFKIYDDPSAGTNWWTETLTGGNAVTVQNGYFSVNLGEVTPFGGTIPWDQELWMTMNVNSDGEMSPRFKLTAVPYAFRAGAVTDASGNAYTGDDLIQKAPSTIQAVNSALAAIRFNQAGSGSLLQLQGDGSDVFTVDKTGAATLGAGITVGNSTSTTAGTIRWSGSDLEVYNGTGWTSLTSGGTGGTAVGTTAYKTANQTKTNDATLADDSELLFPVGANENWAFRFVVQANAASQPDIQFAVNAPSGATCYVGFNDAEGAVSEANLGCGTAMTTTTAGSDETYEITGFVENGANAGNVTLQWAQNTSNANATTVYAGSYVFASAEGVASGGGSGNAFEQGGNDFAGTAILGTSSGTNDGLNIITNGSTALGITNTGVSTFFNSLTINSGGLTVTGGIDNNSGGITEAGAVSGLTTLSGSGAVSLSSGGSGDLTLSSGSGTIILSGDTLRRSASGTTTIDLFDNSGGTTLSLLNSDGTQTAGLSVEGSITGASFSGSGSGLTALNASNISTGTLSDSRLSSNVALLDQSQTFTGTPTFNSGLVLGNSTSTTSGALRWSGSDFEGYDGVQWVSLTSGGGGGGGGGSSPALTTVTKSANEIVNNSTTLQNDNELLFNVGANETWSYRFVVQANTTAGAGIKFALTAPAGATCRVSFIDQQTAASEAGIGCGTASTIMTGTGNNEVYEITGTVTSSATAGAVTLQWAQTNATAVNTTVLAGSFLSASIGGGGEVFLQGGNDFGGTAILGTTGNDNLNFIVNGATGLSLTTSNTALFTSDIVSNGSTTIGDNISDGLTIVSGNVTLTNGLNFDSDTFVIDSTNNRVGIGTSTTNNLLTINDATTADAAAQVLLATEGTANKGLVIQTSAGQTANALEIQNSSGSVLAGFDENGGLVLGLSTVTSSATVSRSITLPDADGTICLSGSSACGYIQFASGSYQTDASTANTIAVNKTNATGNLISLQRSGSSVFTVDNNGGLQIQSTQTAALDVRNGSGTSYFSVDTTNGTVRIGPTAADGTGVLFVLDTKNTSGDPTGTNGAQYYNSSVGKFRCYENGQWKDCINSTLTLRSFIDTVADALIDGNTTDYWDTGAENNNSVPNITLSAASGVSVYGTVTFELTSNTNQDVEATARVERGIGAAPTCGSGTAVGGTPGLFATNNGAVKSSTVTFVDNPNTTSAVYYTLCSDAATAGNTSADITRIRITLQEVTNNN